MSDARVEQAVTAELLELLARDRELGFEPIASRYREAFPGYEDVVDRVLNDLAVAQSLDTDNAARHLGPYRLIRELGRGGQGIVHLAEDTRLRRRVALKVLTGLGAVSDDVLRRFRREAEVAARIQHPGICAIYEAASAAGTPYIAMAYVEGETLRHRITQARADAESEAPPTMRAGSDDRDAALNEPKPPSSDARSRQEILQTVTFFEKAARALHAAHEAGIVHRDVKPGNLMITPAEEPVILDFGLAGQGDDGEGTTALTLTGDVFGTPAYMSPEQLSGSGPRLDRRTDIWSLGVSLYEALTLSRPFVAPTRQGLQQKILGEEPPRPRRLVRSISRDLEVIIATALAKDPDRRYQTADDLASDLRRVRLGEPIRARPVNVLGRALRWSRRRPDRALLVLATFLIVALVIWWLLALPSWRAAQRHAQEERLENTLAAAYFTLGERQFEGAHARFESALEIEPDSLEALCGLAVSEISAGNPTEALRILEAQSGRRKDDPALLRLRLKALRTLGRERDARDLESQLPPPSRAVDFFVTAYVSDADHAAEAFTALRRAVLSSSGPRLAYYLAMTKSAMDAGEAAAALEVADSLAIHWPDSAWACFGAAEVARRAFERGGDPGHLTMGLTRVDAGIRLEPGLIVGWTLKSQLLRAAGRINDALTAQRRALEIDPEDPVARIHLGILLARSGELEEAAEIFRVGFERSPSRPEYACNLARVRRVQRRFDEAEELYRGCLASHPDLPEALEGLARCAMDRGQDEEAVRRFRRCLDSAPATYDAASGLACVLARQQRFDDALPFIEQALRINPFNASGHRIRGLLLLDLGRRPDAVAAFDRFFELAPNDDTGRKTIERALTKTQR